MGVLFQIHIGTTFVDHKDSFCDDCSSLQYLISLGGDRHLHFMHLISLKTYEHTSNCPIVQKEGSKARLLQLRATKHAQFLILKLDGYSSSITKFIHSLFTLAIQPWLVTFAFAHCGRTLHTTFLPVRKQCKSKLYWQIYLSHYGVNFALS